MKPVFDQALLKQRVQRAHKTRAQADFLFTHTAHGIRDRFYDMKRDFPSVAEISWTESVLSDTLKQDKAISDVMCITPSDTQDDILPLDVNAYDAVVSHRVLHFAQNPQLMLQQYLFALKPDGVFIGCFVGGESLYELRQVLADAEQEIYGGVSPRIAPMMALQDAAALMQQTGFALPVADYERMTITYADLSSLLRDLRGIGQTNVMYNRRTQPLSRRFWDKVAEIYQRDHVDERGRLVVTLDIVYLLGWAPHESQPQPKRRGSATVHLGDVLGLDKK
jgi:NADH dehydrogenase [ubiquinone] 1 alpha subcomplex assembly factor 5